jgi:hypothetical protein
MEVADAADPHPPAAAASIAVGEHSFSHYHDGTVSAAAVAAAMTERDNIHPPTVVTLSPVSYSDTPSPDSPLSTPPDSPRSVSSPEEDEEAQHASSKQQQQQLHRPLRQPKEAELLLERKSSLELPRIFLVRDETKISVAKAAAAVAAVTAPFDEGTRDNNRPTFTGFRRQIDSGSDDGDDAPDDEKKIDDTHIPTMVRESGDEPVDPRSSRVQRLRATMFSSSRGPGDMLSRASDSFSALPTNNSPQTTSSQAVNTFGGDEIMSNDEDTKLRLQLIAENSFLEFSPPNSRRGRDSFPEEDGELPALSSPPSPPLELNLASPESSTAATAKEPQILSFSAANPLYSDDVPAKKSNQSVDGLESTTLSTATEPPSWKALLGSDKTSMSNVPHATNSSVDSKASTISSVQNEPPSLCNSRLSNLLSKPTILASSLSPGRAKTTGDVPEDSSSNIIRKDAEITSSPATTKAATVLVQPNRCIRGRSDGGLYRRRFVGVDREQHLIFAALKREIVSRPPSLLSPVQDRVQREQRQQQISSRSANNATAAVVSPDGETDALELSLMVSPDGEIDYEKTILNIVAPDNQRRGQQVLVKALTPPKEREDSSELSYREERSTISHSGDSTDSLEPPPQIGSDKSRQSRQVIQTDSNFVKETEEVTESSHQKTPRNMLRTFTSDGVSRTIRSVNSDEGSPHTINALQPMDFDGGSAGSFGRPSSGSWSAGHVPPNQAWNDYLIFRGVAVKKRSDRKTNKQLSSWMEVGRSWLDEGDVPSMKESVRATDSIGSQNKSVLEETTETKDIADLEVTSCNMPIVPADRATKGSQHTVEPRPAQENQLSPQSTAHTTPRPAFREMTPMKDIQGSEKSSEWFEAELRRRAFVKQEINRAIEERRKVTRTIEPDEFSEGDIKPHSGSTSEMDEEVAAITAEEEIFELFSSIIQSSSDGRIPGNSSTEEAHPRRLFEIQGETSEGKYTAAFDGTTGSEVGPVRPTDYQDVQVEMRKFASDTRAALRDQSFTEHVGVAASASKFVPLSPPSPLASNATSGGEEQSAASSNKQARSIAASAVGSMDSMPGANRSVNTGIRTANYTATDTDFGDLNSFEAPVLTRSMDYFDGIAKGDITLSLLNENTGSGEYSVSATWANRVRGAIWRSRNMRRNMKGSNQQQGPKIPGSSARGRSSLPVDVNGARVACSFRTIASTQDAALLHLRNDEIDEAIELFEEIIFAYYYYFERSLSKREKNPGVDTGVKPGDFQLYIGVALHNLGVLNLLRGDYSEALSFFTRAVENRRSHLGDDHPDHIVSFEHSSIFCRCYPIIRQSNVHTFSRRW